jgi:hypothetical protein
MTRLYRASKKIVLALILGWGLLPASARSARVVVSPPLLVGQVATPDDAFDVALGGDHALVPDYASGLEVILVADPENPTIVGHYDSPGYAVQCALANGLAFVADHKSGGLQVVDISNPPTPSHVGDYIPGDVALMAAWRDGIVLVGYVERRIDFIDVSTPSQPALVSSFATTGAPRHAVFAGPYAYIADHAFGLLILDISNSAAPALVGSIAANQPTGVDLAGTVVYLACFDGLYTIDVTDPAAPGALDSVALPGPAVKVDVEADYAVVAAHLAGGLQVVDASNTSNLSAVTSYVTGRYAHGIAARGDYAYLADADGLKIFQVFDSAVPVTPTTFGGLKAKYRSE